MYTHLLYLVIYIQRANNMHYLREVDSNSNQLCLCAGPTVSIPYWEVSYSASPSACLECNTEAMLQLKEDLIPGICGGSVVI